MVRKVMSNKEKKIERKERKEKEKTRRVKMLQGENVRGKSE